MKYFLLLGLLLAGCEEPEKLHRHIFYDVECYNGSERVLWYEGHYPLVLERNGKEWLISPLGSTQGPRNYKADGFIRVSDPAVCILIQGEIDETY